MASEAMSSTPAVLGRLTWMIVGPFALAILGIGITERRDGWFSPVDLLYLIVLGGMVLGRWTEFRYSQARSATGEPTTVAHLRRYTLVLGILGFSIWVAANLVGNQAIRVLH